MGTDSIGIVRDHVLDTSTATRVHAGLESEYIPMYVLQLILDVELFG